MISASLSAATDLAAAVTKETPRMSSRARFPVALLATALLLLAVAGPAHSATGPALRLASQSNATASPVGQATISTLAQGDVVPAAGEVQRLTVRAGSGQFRLALGPDTTSDLPYDAGSGEVQAALEVLPSVGAGNVSVSSEGGEPGSSFQISFQGSLAGQDLPQLQVQQGATPLGGIHEYLVSIENTGDAGVTSDLKLTATLPPGLVGIGGSREVGAGGGIISCVVEADAAVVTCTGQPLLNPGDQVRIVIRAAVDPAASGIRTAAFEVEGGGAASPAQTIDAVAVTSVPAGFGIDAFDGLLAADPSGTPSTQAAAHPYAYTTSIDFNLHTNPNVAFGANDPVEDVRDIVAELPPGLIGNPSAMARCTIPELVIGSAISQKPTCAEDSQVGIIRLRTGANGDTGILIPVFNLTPPPGAAARFGFSIGGVAVLLDASLRSDSDYGISVSVQKNSQGLAIAGSSITFWGDPAEESHLPERHCAGAPYGFAGNSSLRCPGSGQPQVFFRNPTSCSAGLQSTIHIDSWQHPAAFTRSGAPDLSDPNWITASYTSHQAPGYPYPSVPSIFPVGYTGPESWGSMVGMGGCGKVPFEPSLSVQPTTSNADSPTGLRVDLGVPQDCWATKATFPEADESICQSDLEDAVVTLPAGLSLNPSAATGLSACGSAQIGLTTALGATPIHFDREPASCPDSSKIGTVEIETPLLDHALEGNVYIAAQNDNPFKSLLGLYLVVEDFESGVVVKLPGHVLANAQSGQLEASFDENPQVPFSSLHLVLFGGQRAALRTPATCGTYTTRANLTPWSGNGAVQRTSSFQIDRGCGGGFDPKLSAGTQNPLAGSYSPFHLQLTRADGSQELSGLSVALAPGLIGKAAGIPYCPDATLAAISAEPGTGAAQIASPRCPAASQVGTVTVGAGAGVTPFYTSSGRAYYAGPYKGAPLSLAVVAPAVAGPFDLGSVVVRNALRINPETTQITAVSDPIPTILHGIPLDLRDVRVDLNRPGFTLNPTSCEPKSIEATLTSATGASAQRSSHFQAAACDRLGFKPKLSLTLKGGTKRSKNPALTAVMRPRPGDANVGRIQVALPHSEFLAQSHIKTICTRVQFAADTCPKGSIYGRVSATTPLFDYPLTGNVYLRSSSHPLPDMVLALRGPAAQPLKVDAVGRIDSIDGGIRTTFAAVPDAPLTKVVVRFPGGEKSLLENSTNLCKKENQAAVQMDAQNGKTADSQPVLKVKCPKEGKDGKQHRSRR